MDMYKCSWLKYIQDQVESTSHLKMKKKSQTFALGGRPAPTVPLRLALLN